MIRSPWIGVALLALVLGACGGNGGNGPGGGASAISLGDPISGLTASELAAFARGRAVFERRFTPSQGLGPLYNAVSCASCHSTPVTGGAAERYRNFFVTQASFGGAATFALPGLPSIVIPAFGTGDHADPQSDFSLVGPRTQILPDFFGTPTVTAQRNAIPIFGVGLFETVSDATIGAMADPDDDDGDGISGRMNTEDGNVGRFGVKLQSNSIEIFTRAPLQNQMGITSIAFMGSAGTVSLGHRSSGFQGTIDPNGPLTDQDDVADPEISTQDLGDLIAFSKFLAPPQRRPSTPASDRGELLFDQIGCAKCHVPSLSGSRGEVEAYTDLLLHDMGTDLADGIRQGVPQASAIGLNHTANEFRTQPLWGVSRVAPYLHDGRADTLEEAIMLHGGEADMIRQAFMALPQMGRNDVIAFLEIL